MINLQNLEAVLSRGLGHRLCTVLSNTYLAVTFFAILAK